MPRSIWKGSISFGLVNIPVGLYSAEKRQEVQFHLLDKRDKSPIHYQRVSEKTGKEVPWGDIVRGYEYEEGRYVILSDEDLKRANPEATQTVDILDFVDAADIPTVFFDKPYYLGPDKKGAKSYALLRETLVKTGKVGIAKVVIRTRQYLSAVVPQGDVLILNLLRFAHELRDAGEVEVPHGRAGVTDRELEMAERLVDGMVSDWDPEKYRDNYENDLMGLIEKRVKSGDTAEVEAPAPRKQAGNVVDLMALLKRSVEVSAKPEKKEKEKPAASTKAKPKAAAKAKPKPKPASIKRPAKTAHKTAARKSA
ncbi:MAG: end-binding protein Ku [Acidobacteriota bacterium]|jgi:DNA end-binding protein Ku|nr:end-binding protein Ku [Acidobacteriota bacterium]